ncbi:MAG: GNAT family N-acetyltransferase [Clostridia bacterium]|nr:GNAT family N-acetyltransferase [Clostridia bacterium]
MYSVKRIGTGEKESVKALFADVFTREPWNDDWSDGEQLDLYIEDLTGQGNSLTFGLYEDSALIGISMGYTKHWFRGTEYVIEEFCVRTECQGKGAGSAFLSGIEQAIREMGLKHIFLLTDSTVPAYGFYKKNGYTELKTHAAFAKTL